MNWVCPECGTVNEEKDLQCIVCDALGVIVEGYCTYRVYPDNTAEVIKCDQGAERVVLPERLRDRFRVTKIAWEAFAHCWKLRSVIIPYTVDTIGGEAFAWCENLKEIIIPQYVITMGPSVFLYCKKRLKIKIRANKWLSAKRRISKWDENWNRREFCSSRLIGYHSYHIVAY